MVPVWQGLSAYFAGEWPMTRWHVVWSERPPERRGPTRYPEKESWY
jgi:hypothetical protein